MPRRKYLCHGGYSALCNWVLNGEHGKMTARNHRALPVEIWRSVVPVCLGFRWIGSLFPGVSPCPSASRAERTKRSVVETLTPKRTVSVSESGTPGVGPGTDPATTSASASGTPAVVRFAAMRVLRLFCPRILTGKPPVNAERRIVWMRPKR